MLCPGFKKLKCMVKKNLEENIKCNLKCNNVKCEEVERRVSKMFSRVIRSSIRSPVQFQLRNVSTMYKEATTTLRKDMKAAMLAKDAER